MPSELLLPCKKDNLKPILWYDFSDFVTSFQLNGQRATSGECLLAVSVILMGETN